jgi:hypothetical protein
MPTDSTHLESIHWADGWYELRDIDRTSAWIAIDRPVTVDP